MALNFKFPDVGEGIHEGKLVKWLVKEGDEIKEDEVLAEIETDKAIVEIPSPQSGVILKLYFKEGGTIKVGETLASIGARGEAISQEEIAAETAPKTKTDGPMSFIEKVNAVLTEETTQKKVPIATQTTPAPSYGVLATPSIRMKARELGVDLNKVKGSGPGGRITNEDLENAAKAGDSTGKVIEKKTMTEKTLKAEPPKPAALETDFSQFGEIEKVKIAGIRKRIGEVMSRSKKIAAHVAHFDEADVTTIAEIRETMKSAERGVGVKITYLPFIVKAVVNALKKHEKFNSSFDEANDEMILKKYYNVGIAVDTPDGLVVPVLHSADKMDIYKIADEIRRIANEAKERKMKIEDLRGGSFTITNIGSIGGEFFTPIIYHPEVAILGVGKIKDKPIVRDGKIVVRKMLALSLSFDHRIIDGAEAARFVNDVIDSLENPKNLV